MAFEPQLRKKRARCSYTEKNGKPISIYKCSCFKPSPIENFFPTFSPPFKNPMVTLFPEPVTCPHFQLGFGTFLPTCSGHDLHQVQDAGLQA